MSNKGFKPGDKVPKTGVYQCKMDKETFKLNIIEGLVFPVCEKFENKEIRWFPEKKEKEQ